MSKKAKPPPPPFSPQSEFTPKTPEMIGRQAELERLRQYLVTRGERHFVYYKADGGLGKTRLLEELQKLVTQAGDGYWTTGIIDFYHTDTHSTSDIERAIVDGLDPAGNYFPEYRKRRAHYLHLRELGSDPAVLEKLRAELSAIFVRECNWMALYERKLVLCFDTVELLQYESSAVEEQAGLDAVDARVKPWMLKVLSQLQNVLVVLAGRPKQPPPEEDTRPQERLEADLRSAFGAALRIVELPPLTLAETEELVRALPDGEQLIPTEKLPLIHRLSGGKPIMLHLLVDLLGGLSPEPPRVMALFDRWTNLADVAEGDPRPERARQQIEAAILRNIHEECGELGGYLGRMALMPKGVDANILHDVLGLAADEAERLLGQLRPLSFVKAYLHLPGPKGAQARLPREQLHPDRLFLHDEMYRLLTRTDVMTNLRVEERAFARALVSNYYDRQIVALGEELARSESPEERTPRRERLQKLQVERLYYLLVQDPREGYREYRVLTDRANRDRQVGYAMRLLDEFLRFYNTPVRRAQFEAAGIAHEQIVRESAQMWVERFHWWGDYEREIEFARKVLADPRQFHIDPVAHAALLGNIAALWGRARAMRNGYEAEVTAEAQRHLNQLPALEASDSDQLLARGRLGTTIGYQCRWGGRLEEAVAVNRSAIAAFRKLGEYPDELAIVLNNQAYVHALQGRFRLATILSDEALQINQQRGTDYSLGLSLTNRAAVERLAGDYRAAVERGQKALELFRPLEDPHGIVRSYFNLAYARRKLAKHDLELGTPLREVPAELLLARQNLEDAIQEARRVGLESELAELRAELGKVHRELGRATREISGLDAAMPHFRKGEELLEQALRWERLNDVERANILQDLAECRLWSGDPAGARKHMQEIESLLGVDHLIRHREHMPAADAPTQHFVPLGKVERLRGEIAFKEGDAEAGTRHFLLAYAYFQRYSPDAVDRDLAIQRLYWHLRDLPGERQEMLAKGAPAWVATDRKLAPYVRPGLHMLQELLGF